MPHKQRERTIQQGISIAIAGCSMLLLAILPFVSNLLLVPLWVLVALLSCILFGTVYCISRYFYPQYPVRFLVAVSFCIPLTVAHVYFLSTEQNLNPQQHLIVLFWAITVVELIHWYKPKLLASAKYWRTYVVIILLATTLLAAYERIVSPEHMAPFLISCFAVLWAVVFQWMPITNEDSTHLHADSQVSAYKKKQISTHASVQSIVWLMAIGVIILWGAWLRLESIDTFALQSDEYFHANTGMGYLQTGEYVQWNYLTQEPGQKYDRAWMYTWQVAQSIHFFGAYEWSIRLPALLWGLLFLLLVPLAVYRWSRQWSVAFFTVALVAFDPTFLWTSTYSRMYSLFCCMTLLTVWCIVNMSRNDSSVSNLSKSVSNNKRYGWLALSLILAFMSLSIHATGILLFGAIPIILVFSMIRYPNIRWFRHALVFSGIGALLTVFIYFIQPTLPIQLMTINAHPELQYLAYPFQPLILSSVACFLAIAIFCCQPLKKIPHYIMVAVGISVPIILYLTYFADRYAAKKYSLFITVLIFVIVSYSWSICMRALHVASPWYYRFISSILLFIWFFLPLSFPGVSKSFLFQQARSEHTYEETNIHDYPAAYAEIEAHAAFQDAVIMMSPKYYYLTRTDLQIYPMSATHPVSVKKLQEIMKTHPHGWIVWSTIKKDVLPIEFRQYVRQTIPEWKSSTTPAPANLVIYHW